MSVRVEIRNVPDELLSLRSEPLPALPTRARDVASDTQVTRHKLASAKNIDTLPQRKLVLMRRIDTLPQPALRVSWFPEE